MNFYFDIEKALAAVGYVLDCNGGKINHLNLIKILYASDRRLLIEWGKTITGDVMVNKPHGPALKTIVSMTAGDAPTKYQKKWNEYFTQKTSGNKAPKGQYWIEKHSDPDYTLLSDAEKNLLKQFSEQYAKVPYHRLMHHVHGKDFPEWRHPRPKGSVPIDVEIILRNASKTEDEIQEILEANFRSAKLHKMLNG